MAMPRLADWSLGTTIPAKDLEGTRRFYEDVLRAQVVTEDPGGIIYRSGDSYFSLYPTEYAGTAQHTLGAFMVGDVEAAVADLRGKGVSFEDYDLPGLKTVNGIAELGGTRGAWSRTPRGTSCRWCSPRRPDRQRRAAPATEHRSRRHSWPGGWVRAAEGAELTDEARRGRRSCTRGRGRRLGGAGPADSDRPGG
jgi:catechol 2,3-dioxygenase-like lactoylglutathione lyase family enzyme